MIWGWGVAQFPYLLPTSLKIGQSAAPGSDPRRGPVVFARRRRRRPAGARPALLAQPARACSRDEAEAIERDDPGARAVLFDIDGTILVTGGAGGAAWQRAFDELHGVEANVAEHTDAGMTDPEIAAIVFREVIGREGTPEERAKAIGRLPAPPARHGRRVEGLPR